MDIDEIPRVDDDRGGQGSLPPDDGEGWAARADELADWALERLVIRSDGHGKHYWGINKSTGRWGVQRCVAGEPLDHDRLSRHFAAGDFNDVVGVHVGSEDELCKFCAIDVDNHAGSDELAKANRIFALKLLRELREAAFSALLFDHGKGSYHLYMLFDCPVPMVDGCRLLKWLLQDHEDAGLPKRPDIFPGSPHYTSERRMGLWIRLFGRHHKRASWSKVYDPGAGRWLAGTKAVAHILATEGGAMRPAAYLPSEWMPDGYPTTADGGAAVTVPAAAADTDLGYYEYQRQLRTLRSAIQALKPETIDDYPAWLAMGMGLKELGDDGLELWDFASSQGDKYSPRLLRQKWLTFKPSGDLSLSRPVYAWGKKTYGPATLGSVYGPAIEDGWVPPWAPEYPDPAGVSKRDYRFSMDADAAIEELATEPAKRDELATRWGVPPETLDVLGIGRREKVRKQGDNWVGTDEWGWTVPAQDNLQRLCGLVFIDDLVGLPELLVGGGKHGLIVPQDYHDRRDGPLLIVKGAADTARLLARGHAAVGITDPAAISELAELLRRWCNRKVIVLATPGLGGRAYGHALASKLATVIDDGRPVLTNHLPHGLATWLKAREFSHNKDVHNGNG